MADLFPGFPKVDLKTFRLISETSGKTLDMRRIVESLDYFNSIYDPTVVIVAKINDISGVIQDFPVTGDETVTIEFQSPNRDSTRKTMHLFKVEEIEFDPNGTVTEYMFHMVSIDQVKAISTMIEHGYKDSIDNAAKDVFQSRLKTQLKVDIEPTKGIERIVIPSWNVWDTLELLRERAVSKKYESSYFLFEDATQYNFASLEYIIDKKKQKPIIEVTAYPWNIALAPTSSQYRNASNFKILSKANAHEMFNAGGVHNVTYKFDFWNKKTTELKLKFTDLSSKIKVPFDKKYNRQFGKLIENNATDPMTLYVVAHNAKNESSFTDNVNARTMISRHFEDIQVGFTLYGDSQLQAGDLLKVNVPRNIAATGEDALTGNYMIANLKHTIANDDMFTHVEAFRYGFSSKTI